MWSRLFMLSAVVAGGLSLQVPLAADSAPAAVGGGEVLVITVDDAISPAIADYVRRGLDHARRSGSALVLLRLDTPGGLDTAMRDIIKGILDMPVPVVVQVWPKGGRAASAGAFILMASHVAVMAPATNVGAASPVAIGGDIEQTTMETKATNDSAAYIRELALLRGRDAEWAELAVSEAVSIGAEEALLRGVIEYVADDIDSVLAAVDGHYVDMGEDGEMARIDASGLESREFASNWRDSFLAVISNPAVAGILMLIGLYSLIGELYSGGATIVFGVIGVLCLLLGMYALQLVPGIGIGLALFLLGGAAALFGMMKGVEVLLIPGLVAVFVGLLLLSSTELLPLVAAGELLHSALFWLLLALFAGLCILSTVVLYSIRRATSAPGVSGDNSYIGRVAVALDDGRVSLNGVFWRAISRQPLVAGQEVRVLGIDGTLLQVEPTVSEQEGG